MSLAFKTTPEKDGGGSARGEAGRGAAGPSARFGPVPTHSPVGSRSPPPLPSGLFPAGPLIAPSRLFAALHRERKRRSASARPGPHTPARRTAPSPLSAVTGELLPAGLRLCGKTRGGQTAAGAAGRPRAGPGRTYLAAGSGQAPPRPRAACGPCARGRASPSWWGRASAPWPRRGTPATRAALPTAPAHAPAAGPPPAADPER